MITVLMCESTADADMVKTNLTCRIQRKYIGHNVKHNGSNALASTWFNISNYGNQPPQKTNTGNSNEILAETLSEIQKLQKKKQLTVDLYIITPKRGCGFINSYMT